MNPFEYIEPRSLQEATTLLAEDPSGTKPIAGGTDLLAEIKDGIERPRRLVSLEGLKELQGIGRHNGHVRLGAGLSLTQLCEDLEIQQYYPMVVQAACTIATHQIRNIATVGGNLCQRPRCWYYRHELFPCYKKGGSLCYGATGYNRNLAILDGGPSFMVHPSDMAPALIAMDAQLEAYGPQGYRIMPLEDFFASPENQPLQEHVLTSGEIVTSILLPVPPHNSKSVYLKAQDRTSEDFALASVAATVTLNGQTIVGVSIILGGVSPTPYRAHLAEESIIGKDIGDLDIQLTANLTTHGARPLRHNEYKVALASNMVRGALKYLLNL